MSVADQPGDTAERYSPEARARVAAGPVRHILFVCTGNTCRSPMAAALAGVLAAERGLAVTASSAGIAARTGEPASAEAVIALKERGIDLRGHAARLLDAEQVAAADLVLTMTVSHKAVVLGLAPDARGKVFALKEYGLFSLREEEGAGGSKVLFSDIDVADPIGQPVAVYRQVAAELERVIAAILDRLGAAGRP